MRAYSSKIIGSFALAAGLVATAQPVFAVQISVQKVIPSLDQHKISIFGSSFGSQPRVSLGSTPLAVLTATDTQTIGWIGAGRMGHAMAHLLLDAGHPVHVWNRTRSKAEDLVQYGAVVVDSVAELADRDVVFTMVAADDDLIEVVLGEGGLLCQPTAPRVIVDSSTVSADTSARIRAEAASRGTAFLAAPVSGNAKVVKAGMLSIAASGPREAYDAVLPLLNDLGRSVTYVGTGEVARLVKLAHNIFLGVVIQSIAEIAVLAEKGGVPRSALMEFMNGSVLGSRRSTMHNAQRWKRSRGGSLPSCCTPRP